MVSGDLLCSINWYQMSGAKNLGDGDDAGLWVLAPVNNPHSCIRVSRRAAQIVSD